MFADFCCTYIPNSTAPNGTFTQAMGYLDKLRGEISENAGKAATAEWTEWLQQRLGSWGAYFAQIGTAILIFFLIVIIVLCCCFPIIRNLVVKYMTNFQATQLSVMTSSGSSAIDQDVEEDGTVRVFTDMELCLYQSDSSQTSSG